MYSSSKNKKEFAKSKLDSIIRVNSMNFHAAPQHPNPVMNIMNLYESLSSQILYIIRK